MTGGCEDTGLLLSSDFKYRGPQVCSSCGPPAQVSFWGLPSAQLPGAEATGLTLSSDAHTQLSRRYSWTRMLPSGGQPWTPKILDTRSQHQLLASPEVIS